MNKTPRANHLEINKTSTQNQVKKQLTNQQKTTNNQQNTN